MNFDPRLFTMKDVAQKATLSGRRDLTISILCNSLHALSHSPGSGAVSGSELTINTISTVCLITCTCTYHIHTK